MLAKPLTAWLSERQPLTALDKSVKTCQEFRQGWSRIMAAFAGFDRVLLVPQVTFAARPCFWTTRLSGCLPDLTPGLGGFAF